MNCRPTTDLLGSKAYDTIALSRHAIICLGVIINVPLLILASQSPRRRQLLATTGLPFQVEVSAIPEDVLPSESPADYVQRLALAKAQAIQARQNQPAYILAADTIVTQAGQILGKPTDVAHATTMLQALQGQAHTVLTAFALLSPTAQQWLDLKIDTVNIRPLTNSEIAAYIASGDPFDKAGGYAIQNRTWQLVPTFSGCFTSVMGLPLCRISHALTQAGLLAQNHQLAVSNAPDNASSAPYSDVTCYCSELSKDLL
jgi:septum formation protein